MEVRGGAGDEQKNREGAAQQKDGRGAVGTGPCSHAGGTQARCVGPPPAPHPHRGGRFGGLAAPCHRERPKGPPPPPSLSRERHFLRENSGNELCGFTSRSSSTMGPARPCRNKLGGPSSSSPTPAPPLRLDPRKHCLKMKFTLSAPSLLPSPKSPLSERLGEPSPWREEAGGAQIYIYIYYIYYILYIYVSACTYRQACVRRHTYRYMRSSCCSKRRK